MERTRSVIDALSSLGSWYASREKGILEWIVLSLMYPTDLNGEPIHTRCSELVKQGLVKNSELLDLGSGPFLQPGSTIAKHNPDLKVTCVDPRYERDRIITPLKNLPNVSIRSRIPNQKFGMGVAIRVFCSKDLLDVPDFREKVRSLSKRFSSSVKNLAMISFTEYPKNWPISPFVQASKSIVEKTLREDGFRLIKEERIPRHARSYLPKECLYDTLRVYSKGRSRTK